MSHTRYSFSENENGAARAGLGKLLYLTNASYDTGWRSFMHTHSCAELFFVRSGKGFFLVGEERFPVSQGDIVLINAKVPHTEKSDGNHPLSYLVIGIDAVVFESPQGKALRNAHYSFLPKGEEGEKVSGLFALMLREADAKRAYHRDFCQSIYEQILISVIRNTDTKVTSTETQELSVNCAALKLYIEENYHENLTLDQLARQMHINKYYLAHSFAREYGVPPIQYLIQIRIKEARSLLVNTDHSIAEIANMLGFSSQSYFAQSFKHVTGVTAGHFRRAARKEKGKDYAGAARPGATQV